MKAGNEIRSAVENIQYYAKRIDSLARKQLGEDVELGHELGISIGAGTIRFDSLGAMGAATQWIETYCHNILANLEGVEAQDRLLHKAEEEVPF